MNRKDFEIMAPVSVTDAHPKANLLVALIVAKWEYSESLTSLAVKPPN